MKTVEELYQMLAERELVMDNLIAQNNVLRRDVERRLGEIKSKERVIEQQKRTINALETTLNHLTKKV